MAEVVNDVYSLGFGPSLLLPADGHFSIFYDVQPPEPTPDLVDSLESAFSELLPVTGVSEIELQEAGYTFDGIETFALSPITSSTGLKGILIELLGLCDNIVTQYRYQQNTSSSFSYVNEITPDFPWIFSAVLFIVLVWSVFRLAGVLLGWMK